MRNRVLVLAAIAACAGPRPRPPRGEVVFSVTGRVQEGPYRFGRDDLPRLPRRAFRAVAPGSGSPARFEGVAVLALLQDAVELEVDADTVVFHGREGDVIDGRYRIVSIGVESIVLEHVDGRGRQTIRLTG